MRFPIENIKLSLADIQKGLKLPESPSEMLAEETGWHLGDGSMNVYKNRDKERGFYQLRGHRVDDRAHYFKRIKPFFKELYNIDVHIREMPATGVLGFQIWNDALVEFKHNCLGLPLGWKREVQIPDWIIGDKSYFFAFLRGLFDTDGCVYLEKKGGSLYPRLEIGTADKKFAEEIHGTAQGYGLNLRIRCQIRKEQNWNNLYNLRLNGKSSFFKWKEYIGTANPKHQEKMNKWENQRKKSGPAEI